MKKKTEELLAKHDLSIFYGNEDTIYIVQRGRMICEIETSNCNDDTQIHAVISAFLQGLHCVVYNPKNNN